MMLYLTRRYHFSASHRLHNDALTAEENARIYGKCNSAYGHGHNYVLEVTVRGPIDPSTGMVIDLAVLDDTVQREVLERLDHTNLNLDVEKLRRAVPTAENLCVEIFKLLHAGLNGDPRRRSAALERVRLEETNSNFFEYSGEREGPGGGRKVRGER